MTLLFETAFGQMSLTEEDGALVRLLLPGSSMPDCVSGETPLLVKGRDEILEYLAGVRLEFSLPLNARGTPFQKSVWQALNDIPYGHTRSYRDIACAVDCPRGYRAVGMANHCNPLPILIPCHRVIASNGDLGGYGGGLELKQALLALEGRTLSEEES